MNTDENTKLKNSGSRSVRLSLWRRFVRSQDEAGVYHHPTYMVEIGKFLDEIEERIRKEREEDIARGKHPNGWGDYDDDVDPVE